MFHRRVGVVSVPALLGCLALAISLSFAATERASSLVAPLAVESLLLDGAAAGDTIIAVGERGHLLKSTDQGLNWRQVVVPTESTLTAVALHDSGQGFAVGHDAVVLRTRDHGESWSLVYFAPEQEQPLLDVHLHSPQRIVAIGAYGLYLESLDAGESWIAHQLKVVDPGPSDNGGGEGLYDELHLNRLAVSDTGKWYIAAEAGTVYRSDDMGQRWSRLPSPYEGSFFGVLPLPHDQLLLYGLEGRLFYSRDMGEQWQKIDTGTRATLTDALELSNGGLLVAGYSGSLLITGRDRGRFHPQQLGSRKAISSVLELDDGDLLLFGAGGITRIGPGGLP